jgi:ketosteroid isomerase-like protein
MDSDSEAATVFNLSVNLSAGSGLTDEARTNRELLLTAYHAVAAGSQEALVALLDPEVRFFEADSLPYGVAAQGIEATIAGVGGMLAAWRDITVEIEEILAAGDLVIAYLRFIGTARHTGRVYDAVCAEVFRFRAGRIIEWRPIYWDTHAVREACGLVPAG